MLRVLLLAMLPLRRMKRRNVQGVTVDVAEEEVANT